MRSKTGSSRPFSGAENSMNSNPSKPNGFSNKSAMLLLLQNWLHLQPNYGIIFQESMRAGVM
jgi:hypothetical protein